MTKLKLSFFVLLICLVGRLTVQAQQLVAPQPQPGRINGTVTDVGGAVVPALALLSPDPRSGIFARSWRTTMHSFNLTTSSQEFLIM